MGKRCIVLFSYLKLYFSAPEIWGLNYPYHTFLGEGPVTFYKNYTFYV